MREKKHARHIHKRTVKHLLAVLICFSLLLSSCALPQRAAKIEVPDAQEYGLMLINGRPMLVTARTQSHENGQIVTVEQEDLYMRGLFRTKRVSSVTKIVQDSDGKVLQFEGKKHRGVRNDGGRFDIYSVRRNKKIKEIQISKQTLFDLQVADWLKKRNPQEGDKLTTAIFSPLLLEAMPYSIAVGPMKEVSVLGQPTELRQLSIETNSSMGDVRSTRYVNEEWEAIKERVKFSGLLMERYRCTRDQIPRTIAPVTPNEVAAVQSPVRIRNDSRAKRIHYLIKPRDGSELDLPATDYQKIRNRADGSVVVEVLPANPPKGHTFPYEGSDPEILNALKATAVLECDDQIIVKLAKKAVRRQKDVAKAVEKIRSFTRRYLKTGYVDAYSATEIAEVRKGMCMEHAILMAAMCRSVGIPSNVVSGYVYAGRKLDIKYAFAGHAWVEVYVGEKWCAVDPTRLTLWGLLNDHTVGHIAAYIWEGEKKEFVKAASDIPTFEIVDVKQY